jgi:hypothetical protein
MRDLIRRLLGGAPSRSDINLPDPKKGKPVRSISGGTTKGGAPDDARWVDHHKRMAEQSIQSLQRMGETVRKITGKK